MLTPIRPSLSQALLRSGNATAQPSANEVGAENANPALAARQAFFRQINGETSQAHAARNPQTPAQPQPQTQAAQPAPRLLANPLARPITPATFKAADIEKAQAQGETPPTLRPGSLLNIVV